MTTVKHFHSAMSGAPVLNGTAGSLIAVLDACLQDGFGLKAASGITVASGVATVSFANGHSFEPDTIALIAGATPGALNGEKVVLTTSTNTVTFAAPGVPDGAATGSITAKVAPAGWEKAFSGTNVAAYRSLDPESTRMFLRVDDTGTTNARVVGYESMSDVNTGVGPFPTAAQIAGGGWWPKANAANATARAWTLVSDSRGFILHMHTAANNLGASGGVWSFGDFESLKSGDAYGCALQCAAYDSAATNGVAPAAVEWCNYLTEAGAYAPRSFTALGGSAALNHGVDSLCGTSTVAGAGPGGAYTPAYPNGPDNGLILARKVFVEPGLCLRGRLPGVMVPLQNCHGAFSWRQKIDGQGDLSGRKLLVVKCGVPAGEYSQGMLLLDVTGPWSR